MSVNRLFGRLFTGPNTAVCLFFINGFVYADDEAKPADFVHEVVPILKARCTECHTNGTYKGGLSLETRETILKAKAVVPGKSAQSELFKRITSTDPEVRMPPKGPSETESFLKDADPTKKEKLAKHLLADKRAYADHWLSFWNDLLRNDYAGTGYIDGGRKQISAWLYRSLVDNKPYDEFTRELIAPSPGAEGFVNGIKWRGNVNASQVTELQFAQNVGQVFFGINLKCASCHDSFIDTWKLDDAYGLAAVIAERPLEINRCDKPIGKQAVARFLFPELGKIDGSAPKKKRLEQLAALVTDKENGRFTRTIANRIWHRLLGHGLVHPVDAMGTPPWSDDLLDYLAWFLADNGCDLKKLIEHIVASKTYQARMAPIAAEQFGDYVFRGPELKRMTAEHFIDAVWQISHAGPTKHVAPVSLPAFAATTPVERRLIRASLVHADLLMRSLGRPNREQVVTSRPDQLTTLQALDLSNGEILAKLLTAGADNLRKTLPKATTDELAELIYMQALCRKPTPRELPVVRQILGAHPTSESLADCLWSVFMLPEFELIR